VFCLSLFKMTLYGSEGPTSNLHNNEKTFRDTQTLRAGCSKAEPKISPRRRPHTCRHRVRAGCIADRPSLVKIDARNFELSRNRPPPPHTNKHMHHLSVLCMPVAQVAERQHLRSAIHNLLVAPRFQLNTYGRRAFAVTAPAN